MEIASRVPITNREELSLAYTPGVAEPCLAIQADPQKSFELTRRHNMVAVITDGTAVVGLGDIGPEAGMPVMEGKCVLMKEFGDSSVNFHVCVWIENPWKLRIYRSDLNEKIWWALKEAGITIAVPQLDVHFDPEIERSMTELVGAGRGRPQ